MQRYTNRFNRPILPDWNSLAIFAHGSKALSTQASSEINMEILVSVIIPVYKAEKYLDRFLQSIRRQTMKGVEYIFVDDASPDRSAEFILNFFEANPIEGSECRLVTNPKNKGVGFSRQHGLDHARGKYVIHADPDDWLEPHYLEALYDKAVEENADITFCDIFIEYSDRQIVSAQCPKAENSDRLIAEICRGDILASCWNKLVKRQTIEQAGARFAEGVNVCEDLLFFLQLSRINLKIAKVHAPLYHYDRFTNSNSIQRSMLPDHLEQDNKLIEAVGHILADKKYEIPRGNFISSALFHIFEISPYSNGEFRRRYGEYWKYISANDSFSIAKKGILWFACHGCYRPAIRFYKTVKRIFPSQQT